MQTLTSAPIRYVLYAPAMPLNIGQDFLQGFVIHTITLWGQGGPVPRPNPMKGVYWCVPEVS